MQKNAIGRSDSVLDKLRLVANMISALNRIVRFGTFLGLEFATIDVGAIMSTNSANASPVRPLSLPGVSSIQTAIEKSASTKALTASFVPSLSGEANSMFWGGSCQVGGPGSSFVARACSLGDLKAPTTVVIYGDSFSLEWAPAFNTLGIKDHFKVLLFSRKGCPFADVKTVDWEGSVDTGCLPYRHSVVEIINSLDPSPSLVGLSEETDTSEPVTSWTSGIKKTILQLRQTKFPVDVIFGKADAASPPSACLARYASNITKCSTNVKADVGFQEYRQVALAAASVHAGLINISSLFCYDRACPDVIAGTLVHSDSWHISQRFATLTTHGLASLVGCTINQLGSLAPKSRRLLQSLLAGSNSIETKLACASAITANGI